VFWKRGWPYLIAVVGGGVGAVEREIVGIDEAIVDAELERSSLGWLGAISVRPLAGESVGDNRDAVVGCRVYCFPRVGSDDVGVTTDRCRRKLAVAWIVPVVVLSYVYASSAANSSRWRSVDNAPAGWRNA